MLADDQEAKLRRVLDSLAKLDTPSLIFSATLLRMPDDPNALHNRKWLTRSFGGVVAATRLPSYLEGLRQSNLRRLRIGAAIERLNEEVRSKRATDPFSAVRPAVELPYLSGQQEVEVHNFVIAINAIYTLLPMAARAAGHKISSTELKSMRPFIDLRDFYEHSEQRLPGAVHKHALQAFDVDGNDESFRMIFGLPTDPETGEIMLDGKRIDVSSRTVLAVQKIVENAWAGIKSSVLADTENYLRSAPDRIPDSDDIVSAFARKVGGMLEQVPLLHEMDRSLFEEVNGVLVPVRLPVYDFSEPADA